MKNLYLDWIEHTPLGPIALAVSAKGWVAIEIGVADLRAWGDAVNQKGQYTLQRDAAKTAPYVAQLNQYFAGSRQEFTLPIDWDIFPEFQARVLTEQVAIPYGETRSYGELAALIGKPKAARAVGRAGATNPIPIVIPCHRVIGADGNLRGYLGGIEKKRWLLTHETRGK